MQISEEYVFLKKWGMEGTGHGHPGNISISSRDIAIDSEDNWISINCNRLHFIPV